MKTALIIILAIFGYLLIGTVVDVIVSATNENMERAEWSLHMMLIMFWIPIFIAGVIVAGRKSAIDALKKRRKKKK